MKYLIIILNVITPIWFFVTLTSDIDHLDEILRLFVFVGVPLITIWFIYKKTSDEATSTIFDLWLKTKRKKLLKDLED